MKFAKVVFWIAAIWGLLIIPPHFFLFDTIGRADPPPLTHPGFFYGFVTVALAWQIAFLIIALDPIRLRPIMLPAMVEKFGFVIAEIVLFLQHRTKVPEFTVSMMDLVLGVLFVIAFVKTRNRGQSAAVST